MKLRDKDVIKVITGIRRSGKSVLLKRYMHALKEDGVLSEQILYINFESLKYMQIDDYKKLYDYVINYYSGENKLYILLDEVQKVIEWEKAVTSFRVDFDCDIYNWFKCISSFIRNFNASFWTIC